MHCIASERAGADNLFTDSGRAYGVFNIKWLFLSLVILFEVGSVLCGAAPNMNAFIIGRVLQGVGACGCYSGAVTYISVMTTKRERPLYLSGVVATWSLGSVIGPVIGGAFAQSSATWRWAFYINLIVAALTAPALLFCLPDIDPAEDLTFGKKLQTQDWLAIIVFLGGSAALTMGLTFGGTVYPFTSGSEIALWTVSGVLLIVFITVTIYHPTVPTQNRLYPIHLMKRFELNVLQFALFLAAGCMVTTLYYTPLIFQFTRGDGSLMAGVRLLPFLGGMIFFSVLNGALMPKFGYYMPWYVLGTGLMLIGAALMSMYLAPHDSHSWRDGPSTDHLKAQSTPQPRQHIYTGTLCFSAAVAALFSRQGSPFFKPSYRRRNRAMRSVLWQSV